MNVHPRRETFVALARQYDAIPVCRRLLCDGLTPVSAFKRIDDGGTACLFESVVGGERVGRYSFLAVGPTLRLTAHRQQVTLEQNGQLSTIHCPNPVDELRRRLKQVRVPRLPDVPPFTGGAVGFASYDVVRYVEHLPDAPPDDRGLPDLSFAFYDQMLVFDHITKTVFVIALAWRDRFADSIAAYNDARQRIDRLVAQLDDPRVNLASEDIQIPAPELDYQSNFARPQFESAVRRCIQYIEAGDIFQVVLSQRLQASINCDPFEIYRSLRVLNPSPFMFFLRSDPLTLVGSSPEIMCRVVDGVVTVRPLAGTRPRGKTPEQDQQLEQELLSDPKERAEHIMLVDLGRNDVGRVAQFGSVQLPDVMVVERYSHVMHISSTVTGKLRPSCDAFDALLASLPAGTVSGAPKVRAMQIIDQLEPNRRGPYAGAVGYIDYTGNMDTCIALRTMVIQGNTAYIQAGAGIVADSQPAREYEETINKAKILLQAIELTQARLRGGGR